MAPILTCGGAITGMPKRPPTEPMFERVKVAPDRSSFES